MKLEEKTFIAKMTRDEAKKLSGETVTWHEPNIQEAGIYRDADTGEAVLLYAPYPDITTDLRRAVFSTEMGVTLRQGSGSKNVSRVFGFTTRNVMTQKEACRPTSFSYENPEAQRVMNKTATTLGEYLRQQLPEVFESDMEKADAVLPEWRMTENSLWTSGVINQSSQLPYHVDGANFDTWSAMPVLRRGMEGGHLHIPEYDITINCRDGWALWFNGFRYVHGVTPMKPRQDDGYRYTIVFYAKRGMKDCHTYAVEIGEARKKRKARELGMVGETVSAVKGKLGGGKPLANGNYTPTV
jgi:hypothetical protein